MIKYISWVAPILLAACVSTTSTSDNGAVAVTAGDVSRLDVSTTSLAQINALRAQNGLSALRRSPQLDAAALAHAADMTRNDYYGHRSPNGDTERDRMSAAGYRACSSRENIAWGQTNSDLVTQAWIDSSAHRANILSARGTDVGFAGVEDPDGPRSPIWVLLVGARSC